MYTYPYLLKIAFFLLLSISALHLWGQKSTLHGIVVLNESGGEPIQDVRIETAGAVHTHTRASGKFKLVFKEKSPGDLIQLNIQKEGFEVVNVASLYSHISKDDKQILTIIMCLEGQREQYALAYYREGIQKMLAEKYQHDIKQVVEDSASQLNIGTLSHIVQERDQMISNIEEMARILAQTHLEDVSGLYDYATYYFELGKTDKVIELLSDGLLEAELRKAEDLGKQARLAKSQVIQGYILMANAFFQDHQVETAFQYFEKAQSIDSALFYDCISPNPKPNSTDEDSLSEAFQAFLQSQNTGLQATFLSGTVRDSTTQDHIKGVHITCCNGLTATTDKWGKFRIAIPENKQGSELEVSFSHKKYQSFIQIFRAGDLDLTISLQKNN